MSDSLQPPWTVVPRLFCPWDSPGKNTGVGCHALLQEIIPTRGSNSCLLYRLHWQVDSLQLLPPGQTRNDVLWMKEEDFCPLHWTDAPWVSSLSPSFYLCLLTECWLVDAHNRFSTHVGGTLISLNLGFSSIKWSSFFSNLSYLGEYEAVYIKLHIKPNSTIHSFM